ncbi:MAG: ATP-binding protein [Phycisphaerae bacterium]
MLRTTFEQMKRDVGWTARDVDNIRALAVDAQPLIPTIVDRFYDALLRQPGPRAVLTKGAVPLSRLRGTLEAWLNGLFVGPYDDAYYSDRFRIGHTHVRVGLPQWYMLIGVELIWRDVAQLVRTANVSHAQEKLRSLHKLLTLELGIMLDSYGESTEAQARRDEHSVMEERLTRAEHLAEIGQLAASLAHEIKNPLAGISGAIQIIGDAMEDGALHKPIVREILGQIRRLDDAVKDLLVYASPVPPRPAAADLDAVVRRVLSVLQGEPAVRRVRVVYAPTGRIGPVHVDEAQIEQLMINLVLNAAHASPEGGRVRISVDKDTDFVHVAVEDQGQGMSADVRARAFEPFFTTKAKGTGLGLCICRRIAEAHGGRITLESRTGRGTRAVVVLPLGPSDSVSEDDA